MAEVVERAIGFLSEIYGIIKNKFLSDYYSISFNLVFLVLLIVIASALIWRFYKAVSQKNVLVLDLNQYNKVSNQSLKWIFAIVLYFFEYLIIMPLVVLIWFGVLSLAMFVIVNEAYIHNILFVCAGVVISVRILAYFNEELSGELSKLFLFAVLLFVLSLGRIEIGRVLEQLNLLSLFSFELAFYLVVIFMVEVFVRLVYTLVGFVRSKMD